MALLMALAEAVVPRGRHALTTGTGALLCQGSHPDLGQPIYTIFLAHT